MLSRVASTPTPHNLTPWSPSAAVSFHTPALAVVVQHGRARRGLLGAHGARGPRDARAHVRQPPAARRVPAPPRLQASAVRRGHGGAGRVGAVRTNTRAAARAGGGRGWLSNLVEVDVETCKTASFMFNAAKAPVTVQCMRLHARGRNAHAAPDARAPPSLRPPSPRLIQSA